MELVIIIVSGIVEKFFIGRIGVLIWSPVIALGLLFVLKYIATT